MKLEEEVKIFKKAARILEKEKAKEGKHGDESGFFDFVPKSAITQKVFEFQDGKVKWLTTDVAHAVRICEIKNLYENKAKLEKIIRSPYVSDHTRFHWTKPYHTFIQKALIVYYMGKEDAKVDKAVVELNDFIKKHIVVRMGNGIPHTTFRVCTRAKEEIGHSSVQMIITARLQELEKINEDLDNRISQSAPTKKITEKTL